MVTHLFVLQHWMTTLESRSEIKNELFCSNDILVHFTDDI